MAGRGRDLHFVVWCDVNKLRSCLEKKGYRTSLGVKRKTWVWRKDGGLALIFWRRDFSLHLRVYDWDAYQAVFRCMEKECIPLRYPLEGDDGKEGGEKVIVMDT